MEIKTQILNFLKHHQDSSSNEILQGIEEKKSIATIKRIIAKLISENLISATGKGKSTRYKLSPFYKLFEQIDIIQYYEKEVDERAIIETFNFSILTEILPNVNLIAKKELQKLTSLQNDFTQNISELSEFQHKKELERLAIDLSWKSSQIEGNTYSLLETEKLLK